MHPRNILPPLLALLVPVVALAAPTAGALSAQRPDDPASGLVSRLVKPGAAHLLDRPQHGAAAVRALGDRLGAAAAANGMSAAKLGVILSHDRNAWIANNGRIFYAESDMMPAVPTSSASTRTAAASYPLDQTFLLHSRPAGARKHTIYLDFDGFTLPPSSYWATNPSGSMAPGTFDAFDTRESGAQVYDPAFTDAEKTYVQQVWQVVAEKYAPFDVDVTTEDPGSDAYNRLSSGDDTWGDHVVITDDPDARPPSCQQSGCSGIAWLGTFDNVEQSADFYEPTWVYPTVTVGSTTFQMSAVDVGVTAAHEVGHTFGLVHDGLGAGGGQSGSGNDEYYGGQGNWTPIMGSGLNALTQFSKGEYVHASQTEDDLAMIAARGAPLLPDDWGDLSDPTALGEQASYAEDGVIGTRSDQDVFTISRPCTADLTAVATGIGDGQALDIELSILDANGTALVSSDPAAGQDTSTDPYRPTGLDASATVPAASASAGIYQVVVDGVGHGDPASAGYSDYDSLGRYHLAITGCSGAGGAVPSTATSVHATPTAHSTSATIQWGDPVSAGDGPVTGWQLSGLPSGVASVGDPLQHSLTVSGFTPGTDQQVGVAAVNQYGTGPVSTTTLHIPTWVQVGAPAVSVSTTPSTASVTWTASASNPGKADAAGWRVRLLHGSSVLVDQVSGAQYAGMNFDSVPAGTYTVQVTQKLTSETGAGTSTTASRVFTVPTHPSPPRIGTASSGASGGTVTATARWATPASTGGAPITSYRVFGYRVDRNNRVVASYSSAVRPASARSYAWRLPKGRFKFRVVAYNRAGASSASAYSNVVSAR